MDNVKILICDDDQSNLDVLEILLEMEGYNVVKENDSSKLINKIKIERPDLLLLDLWMPNTSGDEIIRVIRADSTLQELPIIAFSADYRGEGIAITAGANYYISKPFDIDHITELIVGIVEN